MSIPKVETIIKNMTKTAKVIVTIVVVLVVAGGIYWWVMGQNSSTNYQSPTGSNTSGNSDTALNQDLATIDGQMSAFSSDSASIDQSMNDQPVAQSQL